MVEGRRSSIAKMLALPGKLRKGSAISEQDVNGAMDCTRGLLANLCFGLPSELQILILYQCSFEDIMNLRCVSRDSCNMVTLHGADLFRHFTREGELEKIATIYRSAVGPAIEPSFHHLCGLRHRAIIADKLASFMVTHRMCEKARLQPVVLLQDPRKIVTLRLAYISLRPYFFILYHFFESFREILAYTSECNGAWSDTRVESTVQFIESWLLDHYAPEARSRALRLWREVMRLVYRKLRPATYATKVERTFRGWSHPAAGETEIRDLLVFGGLEALYRVISIKGYASRMKAFDKTVLHMQKPSESSPEDDMKVVFGVMPPLPMTAVSFVCKRMKPNKHMRVLGCSEPRKAPVTLIEYKVIQSSDLGLLAPLCADCDKHDDPQLVAEPKGEKAESLETCLGNPSRCLEKLSKAESSGVRRNELADL